MGIKTLVKRGAERAADAITSLAVLSPDQIEEVEALRTRYLQQMPNPNDPASVELTNRLLAAISVEIYNAYLPELDSLYVPVDPQAEYGRDFRTESNIRFLEITKWVTDKKENSLEKLVNVYQVLSREECSIALIFQRTMNNVRVYLAVGDLRNSADRVNINNYISRLQNALEGNFPGAIVREGKGGHVPCFEDIQNVSVASATNIPAQKSDKFISQTIEKLLDGIIPQNAEEEYTLILLASPVLDVEERKLKLAEFHSSLTPYASWQTHFDLTESMAHGSNATVGLNVGASAGMQYSTGVSSGRSSSESDSTSRTRGRNTSDTTTDSTSQSVSTSDATATSTSRNYSRGSSSSQTTTTGTSDSLGASVFGSESTSGSIGISGAGVSLGASETLSKGASVNYQHGWTESAAETAGSSITRGTTRGLTQTITETAGETIAQSAARAVGQSISNTLGRTIQNGISTTKSKGNGTYAGMNFGANFARSSSVTATIGKNEGIVQNFANYNIQHALENLESQMKRMEQSTALGSWDFAAYVLSEDPNIASNVAHTYLALTQGEESYLGSAATNVWRGDMGRDSESARVIARYLGELRHPVFGLNLNKQKQDPDLSVYPPVVNACAALSGKELAYALNFPQHSLPGLPILECTEFGRNVNTYDEADPNARKILLGNIFHMNKEEPVPVNLDLDSLAMHTFITGSTGAGKSNAIYQILSEAGKQDVKFLVIEPAKGEYKSVFGGRKDVSVYSTNPAAAPLLKLNPFSFPDSVHVLEHVDRLVEIFNACWPMYAAMPAVLKDAILQSYEACGWDLVHSVNEEGLHIYPTFADVEEKVQEIIESSDYDAENKGAYKGSLQMRLRSMTNGLNALVFQASEIPPEKLFDENVIADLSRIGSMETRALIMGILILKLQEYRMDQSQGTDENLKHLTVLEEAHNLLRKTSTEQSSESANLAGKSVEMLANAIAEMRTYGEGFVIADQAPGLLDPSVIRNTNTKMIFRLPEGSDRNLTGKSASLKEEQIDELARLPKGCSAVYQNNWISPALVKVRHFQKKKPYVFEPENSPKEGLNFSDREKLISILLIGQRVKPDYIREVWLPKLQKQNLPASLLMEIKDSMEEGRKLPEKDLADLIRCILPDFHRKLERSCRKLTNITDPEKRRQEKMKLTKETGVKMMNDAGLVLDKDKTDLILQNQMNWIERNIYKGPVFQDRMEDNG